MDFTKQADDRRVPEGFAGILASSDARLEIFFGDS